MGSDKNLREIFLLDFCVTVATVAYSGRFLKLSRRPLIARVLVFKKHPKRLRNLRRVFPDD